MPLTIACNQGAGFASVLPSAYRMATRILVAKHAHAIALSILLSFGCSAESSVRPSPGWTKADARVEELDAAQSSPDASHRWSDAAHGSPDAAGDATWGSGGNGDGGPRTIASVVHDYLEAWSSKDEVARRALLASSFAVNGEYTDSAPSNHASSRDALAAVIGVFQSGAGALMKGTSGVDVIDNQFRFTWAVVLPNGSTVQTGEDQGEVGSDGLIRRITGFYDPDPTGSDPVAVALLARALSDADGASRSSDLRAAVAPKVSWIDRWMGAAGVTELETHVNDWVPPGTSGFDIVGGVGHHDNRFRATLKVSGGKVSANSQVFGHIGAGELIDVAVFFDGDLPAP